MVEPRAPVSTVTFIDNYCTVYRDLFVDVRSFEAFKYLHLGMISDLPRKSLPAIACAVGLSSDQVLHHCLTESPWSVAALQKRRLELILQQLNDRTITLVIDETGDRKKGNTTDYVARQYIGNIGKIENGIVSVNAYGIVGQLTFPLLFKVFKPKHRLKPGEVYQTKLQLAQSIIQELVTFGFTIELVLADSFYGESSAFVSSLDALHLPWIMAIRSNHGVWMPNDVEVTTSKWQRFERVFSNGTTEERYIQEVIFGRRFKHRYWTLTNNPAELPDNSTWFVMSHLDEQRDHFDQIGNLYGLRTWVEYGFKQCKDKLGWADYRVTHYAQIERWWEIVSSAYLMVSLQFDGLNSCPNDGEEPLLEKFCSHSCWQSSSSWTSRFHNLQLIIQPYIYFCILKPWLSVCAVPALEQGFSCLIRLLNQFSGWQHRIAANESSPFSSA
ncbi:IS701 family transposase [Myxacorys almedinensis]|uniref:IS701 family transposase n=1 Tax=Myxacorys almedinensis A TaxID=2690445 RepID=A0A8J7Z384_9CYAN|nr:IS701 family transposase [Myxacorys almedinensis]NDJ19162.1 IS701 family transposase [Myxacorys almedinensis A]